MNKTNPYSVTRIPMPWTGKDRGFIVHIFNLKIKDKARLADAKR